MSNELPTAEAVATSDPADLIIEVRELRDRIAELTQQASLHADQCGMFEARIVEANKSADAWAGEADACREKIAELQQFHDWAEPQLHCCPHCGKDKLSHEPSDCRDCDKLITERDHAEDMCDELAELIARITRTEIGEHSSANAPWDNAKEAAEEFLAADPAYEPPKWCECSDNPQRYLNVCVKCGKAPMSTMVDYSDCATHETGKAQCAHSYQEVAVCVHCGDRP